MWQLLLGGAALLFGGVGLSFLVNKLKMGTLDKIANATDAKHEQAVEQIIKSDVVVAKLDQQKEDLEAEKSEIVDKPADPTIQDLNALFQNIQDKLDKK